MFSGKYNKFLTVILTITIIAIIGLVAYFGYDMYRKYYIDKEAQETLDDFDSSFMTNGVSEETNTTGDVNAIDPFANTEYIDPNAQGSSGNTSDGKTYKGFPMVGKIEIPKTDVEYPVLDSASAKAIEVAVAVLTGPGLNQPGNTVIIGHNYRNGLFFSNNKKLESGDKVYITDTSGNRVSYTIYNKYTTSPEDAEYISRDTGGKREITLVTCTDDVKQRIVIFASAD